MLNILRKTLALIFAFGSIYVAVALVARGDSILSFWRFENEYAMLVNSLLGWLVIVIMPMLGAIMLYKNKKAGEIVFGIYLLFFVLGFGITLFDPDFFKS